MSTSLVSPRRALRLAGLLLGLIALLTVASGGAPVWSPRGILGLDRVSIVSALAILFSVFLLGAAGAAVFLHRRAERRDPDGSSLRSVFVRVMPAALVAWALLGLYGISEGHLGRPPEAIVPGERPEPTRIGEALRFIGGWDVPVVNNRGAPELVGDAGNPIPSPPIAVIVALLIVSAAAAWWVWGPSGRSRADAADESDASADAPRPIDAAATHRAVVATIGSMLSDPDPNTAIIGAYAHLLEGLSKAGAPRQPQEGPSEHLRRVLETLRVRSSPLRRLVSLFESARFSEQNLTTEHRDQALAALEAVAADLLSEVPRS